MKKVQKSQRSIADIWALICVGLTVCSKEQSIIAAGYKCKFVFGIKLKRSSRVMLVHSTIPWQCRESALTCIFNYFFLPSHDGFISEIFISATVFLNYSFAWKYNGTKWWKQCSVSFQDSNFTATKLKSSEYSLGVLAASWCYQTSLFVQLVYREIKTKSPGVTYSVANIFHSSPKYNMLFSPHTYFIALMKKTEQNSHIMVTTLPFNSPL